MRKLADPWQVHLVGPGRLQLALKPTVLAQLGQLYFLDLPLAGATLVAGAPLITVEAENWITDLTLPVSGQLVRTNPQLTGVVARDADPRAWVLELAIEN